MVVGVAAVLQAFGTVVLLATIWFAYRNNRETANTRAADILAWAAAQMDEVKLDMAAVHRSGDDFTCWTEDERVAAGRVGTKFQRMGYLVRNNLIDKVHFRNMWAFDVVDTWDKLAPWTRQVRRVREGCEDLESGAFYRRDFELMAEEFRDFVANIRGRNSRFPIERELWRFE